jgi:hypothetical protein
MGSSRKRRLWSGSLIAPSQVVAAFDNALGA